MITFNRRDIVFEPENSLEDLMQSAGKDPAVVPKFYRALLDTEIYILTPEVPVKPGRRRSLKFQEKINVASVEFQGMTWLPAFTSKKRISDYVKEPETCLGAAARNLFEMLPNANFWLNPLSECQKPLPATEIALLMNGKIFETLQRMPQRS
jgi:SseB protein N-terminal domain